MRRRVEADLVDPAATLDAMALERKSSKPAGITDASGQPHIVIEIAGLTISAAPPAKRRDASGDDAEPKAD